MISYSTQETRTLASGKTTRQMEDTDIYPSLFQLRGHWMGTDDPGRGPGVQAAPGGAEGGQQHRL